MDPISNERNRATEAIRKFSGEGAWVVGTLVFGISLIAAVVFSSPLINDDLVNINVRAIAASEGQDLLGVILGQNSAWMSLQGRFFPGAFIWTYGLFWLTQNIVLYKLILAIVLGLAFTTVGLLVRAITRNNYLAALTGLAILCTLSVRIGHDSLTSYTGLVPLVIAFSAGAALILIWGKGRWFAAIPAVALFAYALVTYEVVILLTPVLAAITWIKLRKPLALAVFLIPAGIQAGITLYLRSKLGAGSTAPAYSVSLDPSAVLVTFAKQALAALPLSQWVLGAPNIPHFSAAFLVLIVFIFALPVFGSSWLILSSDAMQRLKPLTLTMMAVAGAWVWFSTSALTAITARWQEELVWGTGYLNVVFGYFGLGLCLASLFCGAEVFIRGKNYPRKISLLIRIMSAGLITFFAVTTAAANFTILYAIS